MSFTTRLWNKNWSVIAFRRSFHQGFRSSAFGQKSFSAIGYSLIVYYFNDYSVLSFLGASAIFVPAICADDRKIPANEKKLFSSLVCNFTSHTSLQI